MVGAIFGLDRTALGVVADPRAGPNQRDVPVLRVVTAVLGDLLGLAGVDHAVLDDADQVTRVSAAEVPTNCAAAGPA